MKPRQLLLVIVALACLVAWLFLPSRQPNPRKVTTRFHGYTNAAIGPVADIFITNSANGSIIQVWRDAGATAGLFSFTNGESRSIRLYPFGRFYTEGEQPLNETTLLLDAPSLNGFLLKPRQSVTFLVAVLDRRTRWRVLVFYEPLERTISERLKELPVLFSARRPKDKREVYSDWIAPENIERK